jgi:hypothetical protein
MRKGSPGDPRGPALGAGGGAPLPAPAAAAAPCCAAAPLFNSAARVAACCPLDMGAGGANGPVICCDDKGIPPGPVIPGGAAPTRTPGINTAPGINPGGAATGWAVTPSGGMANATGLGLIPTPPTGGWKGVGPCPALCFRRKSKDASCCFISCWS